MAESTHGDDVFSPHEKMIKRRIALFSEGGFLERTWLCVFPKNNWCSGVCAYVCQGILASEERAAAVVVALLAIREHRERLESIVSD